MENGFVRNCCAYACWGANGMCCCCCCCCCCGCCGCCWTEERWLALREERGCCELTPLEKWRRLLLLAVLLLVLLLLLLARSLLLLLFVPFRFCLLLLLLVLRSALLAGSFFELEAALLLPLLRVSCVWSAMGVKSLGEKAFLLLRVRFAWPRSLRCCEQTMARAFVSSLLRRRCSASVSLLPLCFSSTSLVLLFFS